MTLGYEALFVSSSRGCPACSGVRSSVQIRNAEDEVSGQTFDVVRCADCGLSFTHPWPPDIESYYPESYRRYGSATWLVMRLCYAFRVRAWLRFLPRKGRVLEIGCGDGWMLRELRDRGWQVVGVERSVRAARAAASVNRLPVFVGEVAAIRAVASFDLVVLFQALEHVPDPVASLRHCAGLLQPGGRLVIAVPNLESWQAKLFRRAWFHLDMPRHLTHFSRASLIRLLEAVDLKIEAVRYRSWEHDPYGWIQSALNALGFPKNRLTRWLTGRDRRTVGTLSGLAMLLLTVGLILPSLSLVLASWVARSGATIEIWAVKN